MYVNKKTDFILYNIWKKYIYINGYVLDFKSDIDKESPYFLWIPKWQKSETAMAHKNKM